MLRKIIRKLSGFAYGGYLELYSIPSTRRLSLEGFSNNGSLREWQQLVLYMEVMEKTIDIPGEIAEFGVASGTSLRALVRLNNVFNEHRPVGPAKKFVYGFDSFEGLPDLNKEKDLITNASQSIPDMKKGGFESKGTLKNLEEFVEKENFVKLCKGLFCNTLSDFLIKNPHVVFSLIHIDCDVYSSTKEVLDMVLPRLSVGGIVLFDEIFQETFPGETAGFLEVYNSVSANQMNLKLQFYRSKAMPWKWFAQRIN